MKLTKSRTLTGLILAVLMALPLASILSRVIYVQSNKNAYQSYSDEMVVNTSEQTNNNLLANQTYMFNYYNESSTSSASPIYTYKAISINWSDYTTYNDNEINGFNFYPANGSNKQRIKLFYNGAEVGYTNNIWGDTLLTMTIVLDNVSNTANNNQPNFKLYTYTYAQSKLDNVFEYSVSQFVDDNDFGKVDLTSWFIDMFLTDNVHNNLYVHFANWYLNYVMLITLMHFLFAVLMWFINYCRRLLDRGMNYDW